MGCGGMGDGKGGGEGMGREWLGWVELVYGFDLGRGVK